MGLREKWKKPVIYSLASLAVLSMILLNLHSEKYSALFTADEISVDEGAEIPNDVGLYTDWTSGYEGVFARTKWFPLSNTGKYTLVVAADTRSDTNHMEVWASDGRSEELLVSAPIHPGSGSSFCSFRSKTDVKYAQVRIVFGAEGYLTVKAMEISSDVAYNDTFIVAGLTALVLLFLGLYIFVFKKERVFRNTPLFSEESGDFVHFVILAVAVIFVSQPMLLGYHFRGHDSPFHLMRIDAIKDALIAGQFPVRNYVSEAFGYGYGAPLFYPDLFLYIPALLRIIGASQQVAYQLFIVLINAATAFVAYFSATRVFKDRFMALVFALLYTTALYRFLNLYTRAALGEVIAMAFLPLVFAGMYEIFFSDKGKWPLAVVGYSGVIQSHVVSVIIILFISLVFFAVFIRRLLKDRRWLSLLKAAGAVVLANLWFIGPFIHIQAVYQADLDSISIKSYKFVTFLSQALNSYTNPTGLAYAIGGSVEGSMGQSLGLSLLFAVSASLVWYAVRARGKVFDRAEKLSVASLLAGCLALWVVTPYFPMQAVVESGFFGRIVNTIQFPWRLLSFATLFFSLAGAVGVVRLGEFFRAKGMLAALLAVVIAIPSSYYIFGIQNEGTPIYRNNVLAGFMHHYSEYLPVGLAIDDVLDSRAGTQVPTGGPVLSNADARVQSRSFSNKALTFSYSGGSGYAELPVIYYPGYTAKDSMGKRVRTMASDGMYLMLELPDGEGKITVRYTGLPLWRACDLISLLFILSAAVFVSLRKRGVKLKRADR
ncbi:MAG: hypothetical protein FWE66_04150 [Oscillospiraceae bacterium]|nr:hypothetical protein [Oscillospiraceae bacterium]